METETMSFEPLARFDHPLNINYGQARVIWSEDAIRGDAWALPGGGRTTDRYEAMMLAVRMDSLMGGFFRFSRRETPYTHKA